MYIVCFQFQELPVSAHLATTVTTSEELKVGAPRAAVGAQPEDCLKDAQNLRACQLN